jgi:hypothetical protein
LDLQARSFFEVGSKSDATCTSGTHALFSVLEPMQGSLQPTKNPLLAGLNLHREERKQASLGNHPDGRTANACAYIRDALMSEFDLCQLLTMDKSASCKYATQGSVAANRNG